MPNRSPKEPYRIPAASHRVEELVRRSRFIATVGHAPDCDAAHALFAAARAEFPDATHHCWAFVAGPPGSTAQIGMSDDGEPHGTAGRPILNALLYSGIGEVAVVVTRYFGGVKLGTGGLSRAYAGAASKGIATLPTLERIERVRVRIEVPFATADAAFRMLDDLSAMDREVASSASGMVVVANVPERSLAAVREGVARLTAGEGRVEER